MTKPDTNTVMASAHLRRAHMTPAPCTRWLAVVVATGALTLAGVCCAGKHPPRNTQSDAIAFSRIEKAWVHSRGANVSVAVIDWQFDPNAPAAANFVFATSMVPGERMGDLKPWHGAWMVDIV